MCNQQEQKNQIQPKWYERGYLPHFDGGPIPQMLTFRLVDSFPTTCLAAWSDELARMSPSKAERERRRRIEDYLDKGFGSNWLARSEIAEIILQSLMCFNGQRYLLHSWVIMPNHVHVLLTPRSGESLSQIVHSWKSFTSKRANAVMNRTGSFWQREYFDRFIRNDEHFEAAKVYIENNPVKASLCQTPSEWSYSSASLILHSNSPDARKSKDLK